ncbi:MAG: hypothetical protein AABW53_00075 [Nanoarchaeota archaeon]
MKKNWKVLGLFLILFLTALVSAQEELQDILLPQQLLEMIQSLFTKLSLLAGGLFGLYIILMVVRIHYERKKMRLLQDIRNDVDKLTIHFGIKHAHPVKNIFKRILNFFVPEENGHDIKKNKK